MFAIRSKFDMQLSYPIVLINLIVEIDHLRNYIGLINLKLACHFNFMSCYAMLFLSGRGPKKKNKLNLKQTLYWSRESRKLQDNVLKPEIYMQRTTPSSSQFELLQRDYRKLQVTFKDAWSLARVKNLWYNFMYYFLYI